MYDHAELCGCGVKAAEDILRKSFAVDVSKALDPLDPDDYLKIVASLSKTMTRSTRDTEAVLLRKALDALDVDWPKMNSKQRRAVIVAANKTLAKIPPAILPTITTELTVTGPRMVTNTRKAVKASLPAKISAPINTSLALRDNRILEHSVKSQALFVTDSYQQRRVDFSRRSRNIVQSGLADGLGRDAITSDLQKAMTSAHGLGRSESYWNVIASTFMNRSRTYGQLASYQDAAIQYMIFEAIMDQVTTDQCAFLHEKRFPVGRAMDLYTQTEQASDPQEVKNIMPWIQVGRNDEGDKILYTKNTAGERTLVAEVTQSRVGELDSKGSFKNGMTNDQLMENGSFIPPLHGRCRSTTVADV